MATETPAFTRGDVLALDTEDDGRFHYLILNAPDFTSLDARYSFLELTVRPSMAAYEREDGLWRVLPASSPMVEAIDGNSQYRKVSSVDLSDKGNDETVVAGLPELSDLFRVKIGER